MLGIKLRVTQQTPFPPEHITVRSIKILTKMLMAVVNETVINSCLLIFVVLEIDECSESPCLNDAQCVDVEGVNTFYCVCNSFYTGERCEQGKTKLVDVSFFSWLLYTL